MICFALTALLTGGHPLQLIIGEDGRYSNSKFQMAIWFVVVIATYLATVYLRVAQAGWEFFGGVNIPTNLLLLSGMSALAFGGAKGITTLKVQTATEAGIPNPKPPGQANLFKDFVQNDAGKFDIGDFQMLVVTFVAVGMYLTAVFHSLGLIESWKMFGLPNGGVNIGQSEHLPTLDQTKRMKNCGQVHSDCHESHYQHLKVSDVEFASVVLDEILEQIGLTRRLGIWNPGLCGSLYLERRNAFGSAKGQCAHSGQQEKIRWYVHAAKELPAGLRNAKVDGGEIGGDHNNKPDRHLELRIAVPAIFADDQLEWMAPSQ